MTEIGAAEFKARCLRVMDRVSRTRQEVVVTKRGVPLVKVVPLPPARPFKLGALAGEVEIVGDITRSSYTDAEWEAFWREKRARFHGTPALPGRAGEGTRRRKPAKRLG
jgi:prevent-host-death family protein